MRARNHQRAAATDELFLNDFGLRTIEKFVIEGRFQLGVSSGNRITDDDAIGRRLEMF